METGVAVEPQLRWEIILKVVLHSTNVAFQVKKDIVERKTNYWL